MRIVKDYLGKVSITCEGEWDKTKAYDRLCMVNTMKLVMFYGGNPISIPFSYISKKSVPKGIDINNTNYWMPVGAQIEGAIKEIDKGVPNGVAPLDENGIISDRYLPSYVQDVLEFETFEDLPIPGESNKIYIVTTTNTQYRWNIQSESYYKLTKLLELGVTLGTAFDGYRGRQLEINVDNLNKFKKEITDSYIYRLGNTLEFALKVFDINSRLENSKFQYIHNPYSNYNIPSAVVPVLELDGTEIFKTFCQSLDYAINEEGQDNINIICHLILHQTNIANSYTYDKVLLTCKRGKTSNTKTTYDFYGFIPSMSAMKNAPVMLHFTIEVYTENNITHTEIKYIEFENEIPYIEPATINNTGGIKLGFPSTTLNREIKKDDSDRGYISLQYVTNTADGILKKEDYKKLLYLHEINNNVLDNIAYNIAGYKYDSLFHIKLHINNLFQPTCVFNCWTKNFSEDYSYLTTLLEIDDELNIVGIVITEIENKIFVDFTNANINRENNIITIKYISNKYNLYCKKNIEIVYTYDISNDTQTVIFNESNLIDIPSNNSNGIIRAPQVTGNFNTKGYTSDPFAVSSPTGWLIGKLATVDGHGFMSAADKTKLNNIDDNANNYSLPTSTNNVLGGVKTNLLKPQGHPGYDSNYDLADFDLEAIGNYTGVASIRKSSYKKAGVIKSNTVIEIADIDNVTDAEKQLVLNYFKTYGNLNGLSFKFSSGSHTFYASGSKCCAFISNNGITTLYVSVPFNLTGENWTEFTFGVTVSVEDINKF